MQEEMKECILDIVKRKNNERKNTIKVYSTKIHDSEYKVELDKLLISYQEDEQNVIFKMQNVWWRT